MFIHNVKVHYNFVESIETFKKFVSIATSVLIKSDLYEFIRWPVSATNFFSDLVSATF